jgi:hypothetical protein
LSIPDVTSLLEWISVPSLIIGVLGITSLAISLYERYAIAKEHRRERFERLVLRSDFFVQLSDFWRLDDICRAALEIREKGRTVISIDDKMAPIKSFNELEAEYEKLTDHIVLTARKVQEGGAFFFAPNHIRQAIGELAVFFETIDFEKMDDHFAKMYRAKLAELSRLLRKEVGLE